MADFSDSFHLMRMRSGNPLIYMLREQFEDFGASHQKVETCGSIARCFYQLEQYGDAADWYETAGRLILSEPTPPPQVKALSALREFEKALDCYRRGDDEEKFTECSTMIRDLKKACAPA